MLSQFKLSHLPALLVGCAEGLGGLWPLYNAESAIAAFGLPARIAQSKDAQTVMVIASSRISVTGFLILALYAQGKFAAVDTVLTVMGLYAGLVDGFVCWQEGASRAAAVRFASGLVVAAFGLAGCTAGKERAGSRM